MIVTQSSPASFPSIPQPPPFTTLCTRYAALVLSASTLPALCGCTSRDYPNPQGLAIAAISEDRSELRADADGFVNFTVAGEVRHVAVVSATELLAAPPQSGTWVCVRGPFHYASDIAYRHEESVSKGTSSTSIVVSAYTFHILTVAATDEEKLFLRMEFPKSAPLIAGWIDAVCGIYYPNNVPELHSPEVERQLTSRDGRRMPADFAGKPTIDVGFTVKLTAK